MTKESETPDVAEKKHLFDNPKNVTRAIRLLAGICVLLVVADLFVHRHVTYAAESLPWFYAFYGFMAYVILVLIARELRKVVMRREDYYDSVDD